MDTEEMQQGLQPIVMEYGLTEQCKVRPVLFCLPVIRQQKVNRKVLHWKQTEVLSSTTGNLSLLADILFCTSEARVQSGGTLMLHPTTITAPIGIAGATGTLSLPATYFSTNFVDGFSQITIGSSSQSGNINLNSVSFRDNMRLQTSGNVSINANQTINVPNTVKMQIDNTMQFGTGGKIVVNNPE